MTRLTTGHESPERGSDLGTPGATIFNASQLNGSKKTQSQSVVGSQAL